MMSLESFGVSGCMAGPRMTLNKFARHTWLHSIALQRQESTPTARPKPFWVPTRLAAAQNQNGHTKTAPKSFNGPPDVVSLI